jgi:NitT/TauT family transport system substrate-binding protein
MKKISRRRLLTTSGAAGLAVFAGARSVRAQAQDTLNIGLSPFINQATIFLAHDLGYFSKVGLDIRMKVFMDGALVVAPMLSGEVELGVMTPNAGFFNSIYRGGPFRAFLCNGQGRRGRAVTTVVARSDHYDAGIKTLPDLARMRGKVAAVGAAGSINQYGLASALKLAGLDPVKDVQWQTSVSQPDIIKQFGQKQVDVADITYHLPISAKIRGFAGSCFRATKFFRTRRSRCIRFAMICWSGGGRRLSDTPWLAFRRGACSIRSPARLTSMGTRSS